MSPVGAALVFGLLALAGSAHAGGPAAAIDAHARPLKAVPDERTAVAIAEAVLTPIYGAGAIQRERPFHAVLQNGEWSVDGTLNCGPDCLGGTAHVSIAMRDGRILTISHGK